MNQAQEDTSTDPPLQAIMTVLRSCYGNLENPNFENVSATLCGSPYQSMIALFQSDGIYIYKVRVLQK